LLCKAHINLNCIGTNRGILLIDCKLGRLPPSGEGAQRADGGIEMKLFRYKPITAKINVFIPPSARWAPSPEGGRRPNLQSIKQIIITLISTLLLNQAALAETCPSVNDIKQNQLNGWKAYDSDDGKPLPLARETQFKKMVEEFALAEWENKSGSIHCYYRDNTGSNLEAYLAKDNFNPKVDPHSFWYKVSGFMHCAAGMERCEFEKYNILQKQQLAKK